MSKELEKVSQAKTIRELFNSPAVKGELVKALPKHLTADKLIRVAMTSIQRTPKLLECSQKSLLACIMTCASLGLEPDQFLGQAYLVPFWNNKTGTMEAQLIPGYRGYIALARRSGEVQSVSSQVVYQNDYFDLQFGLEEKLEHRPAEGERGEVRGAYVVFKYKDGSHSFDYMPKSEIDKVRTRSKSADNGPWVTDYAEMAKKTVIKRHVKLAPLSVEFQHAVALEEKANIGESQRELMDIDEPIDAEFKDAPPSKSIVFNDDPPAPQADEKPARKPRSDKGQPRKPAEPEPAPPPTDESASEDPAASELETMRQELSDIYDAEPGYLMQAQRNLGFAVGRALPPTLDGCRVLLEEIAKLKQERKK